MSELEIAYIRLMAAEAAEACIALGHPEHIRAFVCDGYGSQGVRRALGEEPVPAWVPKSKAPAHVASEQSFDALARSVWSAERGGKAA